MRDVFGIQIGIYAKYRIQSVVRLTDGLDMTRVVDWDVKPQNKPTKIIELWPLVAYRYMSALVLVLLDCKVQCLYLGTVFLRYIGYLNFINDLIKHVLLQSLVHAQPLNCLNC